MRTISSIIISALVFGLTACNQQAATNTATPNLADATSAKTVEATQARLVQASLPKADKSTPQENYTTLDSGNQLMFSYLALAGMPLAYADIASLYSQDYARASDEFRKNDLLNALKPRIDAEVQKAGSQRYFKISIRNPIGKYDFEKKGFPLDSTIWEAGSHQYFSDNPQYNLGFSNGETARYLSGMPEDVARKIEEMRSAHTPMNLIVYCFTQTADTSSKTVKAEIIKVVLTDKNGNVLVTQGE
jgi:hypothetical protein